jgi:hypothetical protein
MRALPTSPPTTLGNGFAPAAPTTVVGDISDLDGLPAEAQALAHGHDQTPVDRAVGGMSGHLTRYSLMSCSRRMSACPQC